METTKELETVKSDPANKKEMYLDRFLFFQWVNGNLLHMEKGKGYCADLDKHEEAEKLMDEGGRLVLTADGKPVTTMSLEDGGYKEKLWKGK